MNWIFGIAIAIFIMFVIGYVAILLLSLHFNDLSDEGSFNILMFLHSILTDLLIMSFLLFIIGVFSKIINIM